MNNITRAIEYPVAHTPSPLWESGGIAYLAKRGGTASAYVRTEWGGGDRLVSEAGLTATFVTSDPSERVLAFGQDSDGAERTEIHLYDIEEDTRNCVLGEDNHKYRWGGWDPNGGRFAFASDRGPGSGFDVFCSDFDGRVTRVGSYDGWIDVVAWSHDTDELVVRHTERNLEHRLSLLEIDSGESRPLTPSGTAQYASTVAAVDSPGFYTVTNYEADQTYLAYLDPETRSVSRLSDHSRPVEGLCRAPSSDCVAYGTNDRGYTRVRLAHLEGSKRQSCESVSTPGQGVVAEVSLSDDGRLVYTFTDRATPVNLYLTEPTSGETRPLIDPNAPPVSELVAARHPEREQVTATDGTSIEVFYTLPPESERPAPAVIDLHGGPERQRRPSFNSFVASLVDAGIAVVEPNVRGSTGRGTHFEQRDDRGRRWAAVHDVHDIGRWVHDRGWSETVSLHGSSYGGLLVGLALGRYDLFHRGALVSGIAHLPTFLERTDDWRRPLREAEYGSLADDRALLERLSPRSWVDEIDGPVYIAHGENDPRTPVEDARQFADSLADAGVRVTELYFTDEGHGVSDTRNARELYRELIEFFSAD